MSFTCDIQLRCDTCGMMIAERRGLVGEDRIKCARWVMQKEAAPLFVMTEKSARRRTVHSCHACADGRPKLE